MWDLLLVNARLVTLRPGTPFHAIEAAACAIEAGRIAWLGNGTPPAAARETCDLGGRLVTPALVDPHTHLVFGGNRANEFEERLRGATYAEIAQRGGGILATVRATRSARFKNTCCRRTLKIEV